MERRRKLKADSNVKNRIEYAEISKTIRKKIKADIWKFNMEAVEQAIGEKPKENKTTPGKGKPKDHMPYR